MFCPKCSQEQVSDETRFCSRCGFQLNVVKALLVNDDLLPTQNTEIQKPDRGLRKRDMTVGAFLMFILAFLGAAATSDMPPLHTGRIIIVVFAWMALTLLINIKPIIQYFLRGDTSAAAADDFSPSKIVSKFISRGDKVLPESRSIPAADFVAPNANTAEMVSPPSVTEPTTNLLNKK
jgi:hypothetical protein